MCVQFQAYTLLPGHVVSLVAHPSLWCDISKTVYLSVAPSAGFKFSSASLGRSVDLSSARVTTTLPALFLTKLYFITVESKVDRPAIS